MVAINNPRYLGKRLADRGFKDWFLYMFRIIEGTPFIVEELHKGLFDEFDNVHSMQSIRSLMNLPPRSGKTTLAKYFLAYSWVRNSKSNFIYTSFSQSLLGDIARGLIDLLENPIFKAMYDLSVTQEDVQDNPVNDFWREYIQKESGKATYSTKKIVSPQGGVILFASVGSAITGFGAGIRGCKDSFSGALIIDDPNKPADIHSATMRDKVMLYYVETLLSRLNHSKVAILCIQQRLHLEDLSGYLLDNYDYNLLKRPLLVNGVCQLPSQYDEKRLQEIQKSEYMFNAQYMQNPIPLDGAFGSPRFTDDETLLYQGICHTDPAFGGQDGTSFTIMQELSDGRIIAYGKLWQKHFEDVKSEMKILADKYKAGSIHVEKNADKGYSANSLRSIGFKSVQSYHEKQNKHVKIMTYLKDNWSRIEWLHNTDEAYLKQILNYEEKAKHDDAPDSAASLLRVLNNKQSRPSDWVGIGL